MLRLKYYLCNPKMFMMGVLRNFGRWIPDSLYLKLLFRIKMGYRLNLKHPKTFSEKLQWLKLYNQRGEFTQMVDKYAVKEYVANIIGKEHVIPTLGVWNNPKDIEWDMLPEKFVLKATNGGGSDGVVICTDKNRFDKQEAVTKLIKSENSSIYYLLREWPYKNVPHRIIAERFVEPDSDKTDLPDYKFFCFNGEPRYCQVISGRKNKMSIDFFDYKWNHQPFHEPRTYGFADVEPQKPIHFEQMWVAARELAQNLPFSRIDFYDTNKGFFFGEITFFPTTGMGGFEPKEWDYQFGNWITLPQERYIDNQKQKKEDAKK